MLPAPEPADFHGLTLLEENYLREKLRFERYFQLKIKGIEEQPLGPNETTEQRDKRILWERIRVGLEVTVVLNSIVNINRQLRDLGYDPPGWDPITWTIYAEAIGHNVEDAKTNTGRYRIGLQMLARHYRGDSPIPRRNMNDVIQYGEYAELIRSAEGQMLAPIPLQILKEVAKAGGKLSLKEAEKIITADILSAAKRMKPDVSKLGWFISRSKNCIVLTKKKTRSKTKPGK